MKGQSSMNRPFACLLLIVDIVVSAAAEGTVYFSNYVPDRNLRARVGVRDFATGGEVLAGPEWLAQLFLSFNVDSGPLQAVGVPVPFAQGVPLGYFDGGVLGVPGSVPGQQVLAHVMVWTGGPTFETGTLGGGSPGVLFNLGGYGDPPGPPAYLDALSSFAVPFPEPPIGVLALVAAAVLVAGRKFARLRSPPARPH
jgi:hypothetical protein